MDFPYAENKAAYLTTWKRALGRLRGWPEARVMQWAAQYDAELDGLPTFFYHESPIWYISSLLVPEFLRTRLHAYEYQDLLSELQHAIEGSDPFGVTDDSYDWDRAKERIEALLREYGVTLADVEDYPVPPPAASSESGDANRRE